VTFLDHIFARLQTLPDAVFLAELRDAKVPGITGRELLEKITRARTYLASQHLKKGDRVALLGHNSIDWVAIDLAIMAEGLIVVPLYARQAPAELVAMMKDCAPALICCGDGSLRDGIAQEWPDAPPRYLFDSILTEAPGGNASATIEASDPVTIIYTSGTSGEAKGVVLTAGNIGHMLDCTSERLDTLMENRPGQDRVFHYLPLCFAGSWIMLLTSLLRGSRLTLNTDLTKLAGDIRMSAADYFLNVPQLLERMRKAVDDQLWKTGGVVHAIYSKAKAAWMRQQEHKANFADSLWLACAKSAVFPTIRKKMIGSTLKALICGSAPLTVETQQYFMMLGIPVLQVYGLTETTAICTLDDPRHVVPGRVGPAIRGIEMKLGENGEIIVRGPNIFPGYWRRPQETAKALLDGWFHSGDQGEVDATGNWKIIGRIKNLIILGSGHNVPPEPIEDELLQNLPRAQQAVLVGNGRGYLSAILTGPVTPEQAQSAVDAVNLAMPHYKQIRAFHIHSEPFSIENGLLTANGKLKRDIISARLKNEIEKMYAVKQAV
jgi:long-chain acyl-CoA synthetase